MANLTNLNNKFLVQTGGNVGINSTSPSEKLEVDGNIQGLDTVMLKNSSSGVKWQFYRDGNETLNFRYNNGSSWSANAISIKNNNNVGIGTYEPATKLQVAHAGEVIVRSSMTAADGYRGGFEADNQHTGGTIWSMFSTNDSDGYFGGGKYVIANESMGGVDANTTAKFVIDGSGKVGIGTSSPAANLHISASSNAQLMFTDTNAGTNLKNYSIYNDTGKLHIRRLTDAYSGYTPTMTFDQSSVGIGTTSPSEKLEITGNLKLTNNGNFIKMVRNSSSAVIDVMGFSSGSDTLEIKGGSTGGTAIKFKDTTGDVMVIHDSKVGIGNTSPSATLEIGTPSGVAGSAGSVNRLFISPFSNTGGPYKFIARTVSGASDFLDMYYGSNHIISYGLDGKVGIGTTSPGVKLEVNGIISANGDNSPTGGGLGFGDYQSGGYKWIQSFESQQLRINPLGNNVVFPASNVGIGTTSPSYKLEVHDDNEDILKLHNTTDGLDSLVAFTNPGGTLGRIQGLDNGGLQFDTGNNAGGLNTNVIYMSNDGKVGIGNQAPQTPLHVTGGLGETMRVQGSSATGKNYINFADSAGNIDAYVGLGSSTTDKFLIVNFTDEPTQFYQKNSIKMTITNVGDVGIGKTNPSTHLDVQGVITCGDSTTDGAIRRQHQTFATMKPGPTSGGSVDMMFVDHTHSLDITVVAYIDTSNVATGRGYSVSAYGAATAGLSQTQLAGNISALSISYVNTGGSENYILRVTCTYSGVTAPVISVTASGQSTSELRAAT